jgi:hypothetical protein
MNARGYVFCLICALVALYGAFRPVQISAADTTALTRALLVNASGAGIIADDALPVTIRSAVPLNVAGSLNFLLTNFQVLNYCPASKMNAINGAGNIAGMLGGGIVTIRAMVAGEQGCALIFFSKASVPGG